MATPADWPKERKDFAKWFWLGTNGNELIKELNCSDYHGEDYIRREKKRPTIYGIVLNDGPFPGKCDGVQWKLCKVGFTHRGTAQDKNNRMEQVKAETEAYSPAVLFVMAIGAVDVTPFSDTEKRIRNAVGWPLHKDLAKKLGLPFSTEWVLTTQKFIDKMNYEKKKLTNKGDLIELFKGLKFKEDQVPSWVKLQDDDGVPTVIKLAGLD